MALSELQKQYAELLLREPEPFKAAYLLYPNPTDATKAVSIVSERWHLMPEVLEYQTKLLNTEDGLRRYLPSKLEFARSLFGYANECSNHEYRIKYLELVAKVMSFVDKPLPSAVTINDNRVLVVKDHGTDDQWEKKTIEHQAKLVTDAAADSTRH